jgi:hypothetical protein
MCKCYLHEHQARMAYVSRWELHALRQSPRLQNRSDFPQSLLGVVYTRTQRKHPPSKQCEFHKQTLRLFCTGNTRFRERHIKQEKGVVCG